jgi:hypothetical protein
MFMSAPPVVRVGDPKRWVVERTIGWLNRCRRRLTKGWEV